MITDRREKNIPPFACRTVAAHHRKGLGMTLQEALNWATHKGYSVKMSPCGGLIRLGRGAGRLMTHGQFIRAVGALKLAGQRRKRRA